MGGLSVWHWLIFLAVALLLFGGSGKISSIMGDVAKGIKSFKKGMSEDDETAKKDEPPRRTSRRRRSRAGRAAHRAALRPRSPARPAGAPRPERCRLDGISRRACLCGPHSRFSQLSAH